MAWWDDEPWTDADAGEDPYYSHETRVPDPWQVATAELQELAALDAQRPGDKS